ncbi:helix-turn-helix domain-containing protein [Citricoccus sp. NPDC055426]|uniref:TetR/AcrR family transcriptional regulator n=1 Tax=Citricoccus sp. NPDC055426 TaxID=3155536 RepID=UPI00343D7A41
MLKLDLGTEWGYAGRAMSMSLRERKKVETHERLLASTIELLALRGIDQITTREIAERAGVGEATLFRYFPNKRNLFLSAYGTRFGAIVSGYSREQESLNADPGLGHTGRDYLARILNGYRALADLYISDPENAASYIRESFQLGSVVGVGGQSHGDRWIGLTTDVIRKGQDVGEFVVTIDADLMAQNCHAVYVHNSIKTHVRKLKIENYWEVLSARLELVLAPLLPLRLV